MPRVLLRHPDAWTFFWRWTPGQEDRDHQFLDAEAAEAWLRRRSTDADLMGTLRRVLADELPGVRIGQLGHYELLDQISAQLRSRWLRLARRRPRKYFPLPGAPEPEVEEEEPPPRQPKTSHWIEIELVDDQDEPVPDVEYLITDPDGTEHTGSLDEYGFAAVDGIKSPGNCKITFPRWDKDAWKPC